MVRKIGCYFYDKMADWENKQEEILVIDENVITAKPEGYVEFGVACADFLGRYAEGESSSVRSWFRGRNIIGD